LEVRAGESVAQTFLLGGLAVAIARAERVIAWPL